MQMVQYRRNQNLLMQVPPSVASDFTPNRDAAQAIVQRALAAGNSILSEPDTKQILAAYGIPVVATRCAATVDEAVLCAQEIGFPVAIKILSPDISHKSDVGGVVLDLETADAVRSSATAMLQRMQAIMPEAQLQGFSVQAMARWPGAHELIIGVTTDPVFGPVILFGQGGIAVEVTDDHALGLPPLNMVLARDMVSRTRVAKLLAGYRNRPPADLDAICRTLIQIAQLVTDLPEVMELDINPLLADSRGVIALDARMRVASLAGVIGAGQDRLTNPRLAIRPYPQQWEQWITWQDAPLLLRPIKPEDGAQHVAFFDALDPEDVRYRMFIRQRELQPSQLARLTQIDYDREIAFIATRRVNGAADGAWETLGVARAIADPDNVMAEFAIIVRSDLKAHGLGRMLMTRLIDYCRQRGTQSITGQALSHNLRVLNLVRSLGFEVSSADDEPGTMQLRLDLSANPAP
jgi:acetyltransferase